MLFAVEGGGFFSSSATGYSKGLALIFLGQQKEEGSTRVLPCNQYQLVNQEAEERDLQLAPRKDRVSQGCTSFVCFRRTPPAGLEIPFPPKVGQIQKQDDDLSETSSSGEEDCCWTTDDGDIDAGKTYLKSSLRKPSDFTQRAASRDDRLSEQLQQIPSCIEGKKVHWTDASGEDLVEVREFEPSDDTTSDGEYENENNRACACVIM